MSTSISRGKTLPSPVVTDRQPETGTFEPDPAAPLTEVLLKVADGDRAAFGELYDRTAPRILAFIRSLLIDRAHSEEVMQEVFLEVWQVASRFDPSKGNAFTWIRGMARLRAIDRIRSTQSGRERDIRIGIRDYGLEYDEVAETVELRIERERIDAAMQSLTELQREAISLSYYGEYSCAEISGMLSVPLGTVKTRLRDGLIRLRREMSVLV